MTTWLTGEQAAEAYGLSIAEVDALAASGAIPAQYGDGTGNSWQLLVGAPASGPTDEVQHLAISGGPNGGTFRLGFDGQWTNGIAFHPSATQITTALTALSNVGTGNVSTAKVGSWDYDITFKNALGKQNVSQLVPDDTNLNGGTVSVSTIVQGSA
jgi:hypothetical protein